MATATWPTHPPSRDGSGPHLGRWDRRGANRAPATSGREPTRSMTQIAADALGLPVGKVHFELGDRGCRRRRSQGGSMTVASVGSAVHEAAKAARAKVLELAGDDDVRRCTGDGGSAGARTGAVPQERADARETYATFSSGRKDAVEVTHESKPGRGRRSSRRGPSAPTSSRCASIRTLGRCAWRAWSAPSRRGGSSIPRRPTARRSAASSAASAWRCWKKRSGTGATAAS